MNSSKPQRWITPSVFGIVLATFFSDVSHEMCTAVLPLYLASIHLGPAALGVIEGIADLLVSLSKLGGGVVGHHVERKKPWAASGYLATALATSAMAFANRLTPLVALRTIAWSARGFRSPLRDFLLADAVSPQYFGRVYGIERAGDMLGAVVGPLIAAGLVWWGLQFQTIILWALAPGILAAASIWFLLREKPTHPPAPSEAHASTRKRARIPRAFWLLLVGVMLFGMGDFSRTFFIYLGANALGMESHGAQGLLSLAVLLYLFHNLVSALAAYPIGHWGDRRAKLPILVGGYALGVATNLWLAASWQSMAGLVFAALLSGVYIAVEETLEKAVAAEFLPRDIRSLGFGILACANALGDMVSSIVVGLLLGAGKGTLAFALAAGAGALGVIWLWIFRRRLQVESPMVSAAD